MIQTEEHVCGCSGCDCNDSTKRGGESADPTKRDRKSLDSTKRREFLLLIVSGFFAILGVTLHFINLPETPLAAPVVWLTPAFFVLASSVIGALAGLALVAPQAVNAIKSRRIDINILIVLAVVGAWLLGDFAEAAIVVFLFCTGEWIEGFAVRRNRESITSLIKLTPDLAFVEREGEVFEVAPEDIKVGEFLVIRPGARVPLDGVVVKGVASLDEAAITGESMPVYKQLGAEVYAGSLSVDGRLVIATTATVSDSTLARIVRLVKESQAKRSPYERTINRFARYYTPLIVLVAALVAFVPSVLDAFTPLVLGSIETWGYRALSVLVVGCPCALVIATPVSVVSGLTRAARSGILIKGGAFLELGAKVKTIAFDKTGTLTCGCPELSEIALLEPAFKLWGKNTAFVEKNVLALAATLEGESTHPLARAVVAAAAQKGVERGALEGDVIEFAGRGISGVIKGTRVAVGSVAYAEEQGTLDSEARLEAERIQSSAASALIVIYGDSPLAVIAVRDHLRKETPAVIAQLTAAPLNCQTVILSGDNEASVRAIAREAGVGKVAAGLLPHEKMERIQALKKQRGIIAMVGDGINDAPALACADIGIAANAAASDTALEVADVALMGSSLEALPMFFKLARATVGTIKINIVFALMFKIVVLALVVAGFTGMWAAIAADVGVLILVLLHSITLLRRRV